MIAIVGAGHWFIPGQWLFKDLSISVPDGTITAILGSNGRGKTTLLRAVCGTLALRQGTVIRPGSIGYVPQANTVASYSALEMVLLGRSRRLGRFGAPSRNDVDIAIACLDEVGLAAVAERRYDYLSGGQRQLVLLARALATECQALIFDEPASALDLANQGVVLRLMHRLATSRGISIMFTTHDPGHALAVADSALMLFGNDSYVFGSVGESLNEANLARLYGVATKRISFSEGDARGEAVVPLYGIAR